MNFSLLGDSPPSNLGKGPLLSPSQGGGGAFSPKLGSELFLACLGGGAAFHEAAADKKLQGNGCLKASYFLGISSGFGITMGKKKDCCPQEVGMK